MTKPHPAHLAFTGLLMLLSGLPLASRAGEPLIVVEDRGGTSALPYYEALNLQPRANAPARPSIPTPQVPATRADEAAMLPVRSAKLTPGTVARRVIEAPGLRPFVVIGDDEASRAWLQRRAAALRERGAVGLVVNVETAQGLARLRALVGHCDDATRTAKRRIDGFMGCSGQGIATRRVWLPAWNTAVLPSIACRRHGPTASPGSST